MEEANTLPVLRTIPVKTTKKPKTFLVVYRTNAKNQYFEANGDRWFFSVLSSVHYAALSGFLDMIMLMDGITQDEFINDSGYTIVYPMMKKETVVLEAG